MGLYDTDKSKDYRGAITTHLERRAESDRLREARLLRGVPLGTPYDLANVYGRGTVDLLNEREEC